MTGTSNQIQTPFGSGVRTSLGLSANAAGGISLIPSNPSQSFTGTLYGAFFTVWEGATINAAGYTPAILSHYDNVAANGATATFPTITAIDIGNIQVIVNSLSGLASFPITSFTANNLYQINGAFSWQPGATLATLTMPALKYIGSDFGATFQGIVGSLSLPALVAINGGYSATTSNATSISMPNLVYIGGLMNPGTNAATTMNFNSLAVIGTSIFILSTVMATFSLPAIISIGGSVNFTGCTILANFSFGSTLKSVSGQCLINNCALTQASVDGILVSLAALDGTNGTTSYNSPFSINLSGGTSATPSATGLTAKAILNGRGVTVTTN